MGLHSGRDYDHGHGFSDYDYGEDMEALAHKRHLRRLIEEKLEMKRLKNLCKDDLEDVDDFDWDDFK